MRKALRTIFVGLGGTGNVIVRHVKQEMLRHGYDLPIFRYLVLDTVPYYEAPGMDIHMHLHKDEEYLYLGGFNTEDITKDTEVWKSITPWWGNRDLNNLITVDEGSGLKRAVGRLGFFYHFEKIQMRMERTLREVMSSSNRDIALMQNYDVPTTRAPIIYIVFSLYGGTGSGLFLDVAYVMRKLLDVKPTIVGIAVLPGSLSSDTLSLSLHELIRANTYASLQELERLHDTAIGHEKPPNERNIWDVQYAQNFRVDSQDLPFDYIYLIDDITTNGERYTREQVYGRVSQALFWLSGPSTALHFWERSTNLIANTLASGGLRDATGELKLPKYSSLGVSTAKLQWDNDRLKYSLYERIIDFLCNPVPVETTLPGWLGNANILFQRVRNEPGANPIFKGMKPTQYFKNRFHVEDMLNNYRTKYEIVLSGLPRSMTWKNYPSIYSKRAIDEINAMLLQTLHEKGPIATLQAIKKFGEDLETLRYGMQAIEVESLRQANTLQEEHEKLRQNLTKQSLFDRLIKPESLLNRFLHGLGNSLIRIYIFGSLRPGLRFDVKLQAAAENGAELLYKWYLEKLHYQICQIITKQVIEPIISHLDQLKSSFEGADSELLELHNNLLQEERLLFNTTYSNGFDPLSRIQPHLSEKDQVKDAIRSGKINLPFLVGNVLKQAFESLPSRVSDILNHLRDSMSTVTSEAILRLLGQENLLDRLLENDMWKQRELFLQRADCLWNFGDDMDQQVSLFLERINLLGYGINQSSERKPSEDKSPQLNALLQGQNERVEAVPTDISTELALLKTIHGIPVASLSSISELYQSYQKMNIVKAFPFLHTGPFEQRDNREQAISYALQCWQTLTEYISSHKKPLPSNFLEDIVNILSSLLGVSRTEALHTEDASFSWAILDVQEIFKNIRMSRRLPIILFTGSQFSKNDVTKFQSLMKRIAPNLHVSLLLLFLNPDDLKEALKFLKEKLQRVFAEDVIPLVYDDFLNVITAKDPQKIFRDTILSKVNLDIVSPFIIEGPTPPDFFFGREHQLRAITEHIEATSFILVGGRRVGKTSIMNRLHTARLPELGFRTLFFDCSTVSINSSILETPIRDWSSDPPANAPQNFAELFLNPPQDKPLVLLLDEADKLIPEARKNDWHLFKTLRALMNSKRLQVILSGERTLREAVKEPESPLFNFANLMLLGPLDYSAINELVTNPMEQLGIEIEDQDSVVKYIYEFTSGHPNIVQRLCSYLVAHLNKTGFRRIALAEVTNIIEDPHFQENDFLRTYWEGASALEQIITLVLSARSRAYRPREVRQLIYEQAHIQPSAKSTKEALDRLVELRSILKLSQRGYEFAIEAFPLVLSNTITVEDLLEVLVEEFNKTEYVA